MSQNLELSLKINVDQKEGESNLQAFTRAFNQAMKAAGKSADEVKSFYALNEQIKAGKASVESLDDSMRSLYETFQQGSQTAADKDLLGLKQHQAIQAEIEATRAAYDRLAKSGSLTSAELAQAALKTEDRIRELKAQTNGWAESLTNAKGALLGLGASAAGLVAVTGQAIEFESAMADVKKVVNGSDEQIDALTSRIKELTQTIPLSAVALAQIAAAGGQLGVPIEKLDQFITLAAQMATAFDMTAEEAGNAVAKLSNVFDIPIEKVGELGDAINLLGNTTAAREKDIVDVLTRIGGSSVQFGLTVEQAAALASTMLSLGSTSEVAGTGINALLAKLQTANVQGPAFQQALSAMGISAKQLAAEIQANPQKALTNFLETLKQLDNQSRAEILTNLFGQEYQDDIARLLNGLDQYKASLSAATDRTQTAGAMQNEFSQRVQTTEAQIQLLKNGIENIGINLGSVFLPAVRAAASGLADVSQAIAKVVETYPGLAGAATVLATTLASVSALKIAYLSLRLVGVKTFADISAAVAATNVTMGELAATSGKTGAAIKSAGLLAAAGWVGWNIGTGLKDQFVEVERAGIALAAGMTKIAERVKFAFAVLNTKTDGHALENINKAYVQMQANLQKIDDEYADLFAHAGEHTKAEQNATQAAKQAAAAQAEAQKQAAAAKAQATAAANEQKALNNEISIGAQQLIDQVNQLGATGKTAAEAFAELSKNLNLNDTEQLTQFGEALSQLGKTGELSAKATGDAWAEQLKKMSTQDLALFVQNAEVAFGQTTKGVETSASAISAAVTEAAQRAGVDIEQALGKVTPATQTALGNINALQQGLQAAGYTAKDQGTIISAALEKAFASAKTNADVDEIKTRIEALGAQGLLTGNQIAQGAQLAEQALNRINGAAVSAQQAIANIKAPSDIGPALDAIQESFNKGSIGVGEYYQQIGQVLDKSKQMDSANKKTAKSTKDVGDAAEKTAKSTDVMAQATYGAGAAAEVVARKIGSALASIGALSKAAQAAAEAIRPASNDWRDWAAAVGAMDPKQFVSQDQALSGLNEQLKSFQAQAKAAGEQAKYLKEQAMFGPGIEWNQLSEGLANIYSFTVKLADAKARVAEFQIALYGISSAAKDGSDSLETQALKLNALKNQYRDLDKASLRQLQDQIDQVNEKLKSMQDQADQTLQSLQEELAQQQGNFATAAEIEGAQKLLRLQEQLNEAKAAGNAAAVTKLEQALRIQQQLNDAAIQEARTREQQAKADAANKNTPPAATGTTENTTPAKTVNVRLTLPNGQTKTVTTTQGSEDALLSALESLRARS
ncbi:MAG: phage tail tape measure protein [Halothiobacillaceae bacterium]|nr:phage tail tape measure protein [Halothiobacillaceae bacterium]